MLVHIFQKLFDVRVAARVQVRIVDVDYHILEVVLLLLPFQVLLKLWQTEGFKEDLNAQVFKVVGLYQNG